MLASPAVPCGPPSFWRLGESGPSFAKDWLGQWRPAGYVHVGYRIACLAILDEALEVGRGDVGVEGCLVSELFVEEEGAGLFGRAVEAVLQAACFGAGGGDEGFKLGGEVVLAAGDGVDHYAQHDWILRHV